MCLLAIPRHLVQNISQFEKRFGRFARGLLFMGRPLFFMTRQSEDITFSATAFFQSPTVVDQYLPLALVA